MANEQKEITKSEFADSFLEDDPIFLPLSASVCKPIQKLDKKRHKSHTNAVSEGL
jgi:hypothetical protein